MTSASQRRRVAVAAVSATAFVALGIVSALAPGAAAAAGSRSDVLGILAGPIVLPLATLAIAVGLLAYRRLAAVLFLLVAVAGTGVIGYLAKGVLQALASNGDDGALADFPSVHVAATMSFCAALAIIAWPRFSEWQRKAAAVLVAVTPVLVGWSRVATGQHSWLDVAGGVALAVAWVATCLVLWPPRGGSRPLAVAGGLVATLIASALAFALVAHSFGLPGVSEVDADVAQRVAGTVPRSLEWLALPFTWLGGTIGMVLVVGLVIAALLREGERRDALFVGLDAIGVTALVWVAKNTFERARPHAGSAIPLPDSFSFPSGHAATGIAVFGLLGVLLAERARSGGARVAAVTGGLTLGVLIGASRVILNVHYVSDVLAGYCLGLAWLSALLLVRMGLARRRPGSGTATWPAALRGDVR